MTELTRQQAAEALKISPKSLARLVKDPSCPLQVGRKRGRQMVWPKDEVDAACSWKQARGAKAAARKTTTKQKKAAKASDAAPAALRRRDTTLANAKPQTASASLASRAAEFKIPIEPITADAGGAPSRPDATRRAQQPLAFSPKTFQKMAALSMRMALDPRCYDPRSFMPLMLGPMNPLWWISAGAPRRPV